MLNYVDTAKGMTYNEHRKLCHGMADIYVAGFWNPLWICKARDFHEKGEPWKNTIQVRFPNPPELPVW